MRGGRGTLRGGRGVGDGFERGVDGGIVAVERRARDAIRRLVLAKIVICGVVHGKILPLSTSGQKSAPHPWAARCVSCTVRVTAP